MKNRYFCLTKMSGSAPRNCHNTSMLNMIINRDTRWNYEASYLRQIHWDSMYGIFTYIWVIYGVNVGKSSSTMEPMGMVTNQSSAES